MRYHSRLSAHVPCCRAVPGVSRLHHLCCADYVARLCESQGRVARDDARWVAHMAAAEAAG